MATNPERVKDMKVLATVSDELTERYRQLVRDSKEVKDFSDHMKLMAEKDAIWDAIYEETGLDGNQPLSFDETTGNILEGHM